MTPERLRQCLDITGFGTRGLGQVLGRDDRRVRRWLVGERPIPPDVAEWLDGLAGYMETHPPPPPPSSIEEG